ncbi:DNA (cytosine-5)-methyltransferase 1 [Methylorubrum zatmanii]|nr:MULTISPECIES: DNA cytosine methyltransferase [Methylorubrum]MCP1550656.1 DNA (cytosine-5)-methyltransferase 1 [Methylorubrum zatmanii]MCP1552731.1 DNA (cytosine-5)-methyltransferase 1 [Methylorubrum extorquens]MCP1580959.1 DNA (cytosine-5)-methyltransferase 1 [Methylorubrum extorquens]
MDLFSGIGGFSLGLERASGFETVAFCEIDPFCRRVLAKHWPEVPCYDDVHTLTTDRLRSDGIAVDVVCGGFPCQDLSLAGPGSGLAGARSGLFWQLIRAIRMVRPTVAVVENVAALLGRGMGTVLGALAEEGYDAEWDCVRAVDAGRPHPRDRAYLVAHAQGDGWGPGWPGGLADGLAGLPIEPCWSGDPVAWFEERFAQPALLGMDDGLPGGLHRLGPCGNAVVPQIPELIGRAILSARRASHTPISSDTPTGGGAA